MQHRPPPDDSDWLFPADEPLSQAQLDANTLALNPGAYRADAYGEASVVYARLFDAICEPPMSPEALVCDAASCALAMCAPDEARWILTELGRARIAREVRAYRRSA
jgi:hypothetical protein